MFVTNQEMPHCSYPTYWQALGLLREKVNGQSIRGTGARSITTDAGWRYYMTWIAGGSFSSGTYLTRASRIRSCRSEGVAINSGCVLSGWKFGRPNGFIAEDDYARGYGGLFSGSICSSRYLPVGVLRILKMGGNALNFAGGVGMSLNQMAQRIEFGVGDRYGLRSHDSE